MIPFIPEPLAALQQRFLAALEVICDIQRIESGSTPRPGTQRQHVFDWEDGVRMIISRDQLENRHVVVHLSASVNLSTYDVTRLGRLSPTSFVRLVEQHWKMLGGPPVTLEGFSPEKGVPHWYGQPQEAPS